MKTRFTKLGKPKTKTTPGCICNKEKENQKGNQEKDTSKKVKRNVDHHNHNNRKIVGQ